MRHAGRKLSQRRQRSFEQFPVREREPSQLFVRSFTSFPVCVKLIEYRPAPYEAHAHRSNDRASSSNSRCAANLNGPVELMRYRLGGFHQLTEGREEVGVKKMMNMVRRIWLPVPAVHAFHVGHLLIHGSRLSARSSTPKTFIPAGCAWHAAWLQAGSL